MTIVFGELEDSHHLLSAFYRVCVHKINISVTIFLLGK